MTQSKVLPPTHITLRKYGCIYYYNVSRYIYISEEYYGSEGVIFFEPNAAYLEKLRKPLSRNLKLESL
jgi:hypothetical protein